MPIYDLAETRELDLELPVFEPLATPRLLLDVVRSKLGVASEFQILLLYPGKDARFQAFTSTLSYSSVLPQEAVKRGEGILLRLVRVILILDFLHANLKPTFLRVLDILLLQVLDAAVGQLAGVDVHLQSFHVSVRHTIVRNAQCIHT